MTTPFQKYEGLGNDFIVVDAASEAVLDIERARALCDRHFGVGADGVLLVLPPSSAGARARMVVLNADGTRPEMCGNGIRCVALHLARRDGAPGISYAIDTDAGPLACEVERDGDTAWVRVGMGRGRPLGEHRQRFDGREIVFDLVSMGNPHAISFTEALDPDLADRLGPAVQSAFPEGTNVELCQVSPDGQLDLLVWERGVGRTLACGTGAAATAVAAARSGRVGFGVPVSVKLPGGRLEIRVDADDLEVSMRGPARRVFSGELDEPRLTRRLGSRRRHRARVLDFRAVPEKKKKIAIIGGDGIGPEVVREATRLLDCTRVAGCRSICGSSTSARTVFFATAPRCRRSSWSRFSASARRCCSARWVIRACPRWSTRATSCSACASGFDLYANIRPVRALADRLVPLKGRGKKDVDFVVFRENTEGVYVGVGGQVRRGTPTRSRSTKT